MGWNPRRAGLNRKCQKMRENWKLWTLLLISMAVSFVLMNDGMFRIDATKLARISTDSSQTAANTANEVIFVLRQESDSCEEWRSSFPTSFIVIVGSSTRPGIRSGKKCLHIENMAIAFDVLVQNKMLDGPVLVSDGSLMAKTCVQRVQKHAVIASSSRYRIMYNGTEPIYSSRHHFGCGGTEGALDEKQPYFVCRRSDTLGPIVGIHGEGPYCENVHPSMALTQGIHALPKMQCAWIPKTSLWMLPFLDGTPGRSTIAKRMLVEKLLWQTGNRIQVTPHVSSKAHSLTDSKLASMRATAEVLAETACDKMGPKKCWLHLARVLMQKGYLSSSDFELIEKMSVMIGLSDYSSPTLRDFPKETCLDRPLISHLSSSEENSSSVFPNLENRKYLQNKICGENPNSNNFTDPWLQYRDILLIVTANSNRYYRTFPYYDSLYRQFFPHILYCGPGEAFPLKGLELNSFNFLGYRSNPETLQPGSLHYECLIQASGVGYNVRGYLMSADDIFLNMHRIRHNDINKAWYYQFNNLDRVNSFNNRLCRGTTCGPDHGNYNFWHRFDNSTCSTITELSNSQMPAAMKCNTNRAKYFGGIDWHVRVFSDMSFTPTRYIEDVVSILEVFLKYESYLEIALPTSLTCIIPPEDIDPIYMDLHNLETPASKPYSHLILKPTNPDVNLLSLTDPPILFKYDNMREQYMFITPQHMQGMSIFHRYKFSLIEEGKLKNVKLHCEIINFLGDPNGDADKHITRYTWDPKKKPIKKIIVTKQ